MKTKKQNQRSRKARKSDFVTIPDFLKSAEKFGTALRKKISPNPVRTLEERAHDASLQMVIDSAEITALRLETEKLRFRKLQEKNA